MKGPHPRRPINYNKSDNKLLQARWVVFIHPLLQCMQPKIFQSLHVLLISLLKHRRIMAVRKNRGGSGDGVVVLAEAISSELI